MNNARRCRGDVTEAAGVMVTLSLLVACGPSAMIFTILYNLLFVLCFVLSFFGFLVLRTIVLFDAERFEFRMHSINLYFTFLDCLQE